MVEGQPLNPQIQAMLSDRTDVRATVGIAEQSGVPLFADNRPAFTRVLLFDVAALRKVQRGVQAHCGCRGPSNVRAGTGGDSRSKDFDKGRSALRIDDLPVEVVGTARVPSPLSPLTSWILMAVPRQALRLRPGPPDRLLVSTTGASETVRDAVRAVPGDAEARTTGDVARRIEDLPLVPGIRHAAQIMLGALVAMCLAVIALALVRGEANRSRQAAPRT